MGPQVVVQCAAVSDTGECRRSPGRSREINVTGSVNISRVCRDLGVKCILCSSDQVYFGSPVGSAHTEDEVLSPGNEYGRQKLEMETLALEENPDCVLLRLSWMYDAKRRAGEHGNFMDTLLKSLENGGELTFPIYDRRGITHVREVVENLEQTFTLPGGVYNFGAGNEESTFDTMKQVFAQVKPDVLPRMRENREAFAGSPRNLAMDGGKLAAEGIRFSSTAEGLAWVLKEAGI